MAKGYKYPGKLFVLKFAEGEHEGLIVKVKSLPIGQFLEMAGMAKRISGSEDQKRDFDPSSMKEMFELFAKCLHSWNLEDEDDQPIPATKDGLYALDLDFVLTLILAWMDGVAGVSGPLGRKSTDGEKPDPAASLPMAPL